MATVTHLFLKKSKGSSALPVQSVSGIRGYGLESDVHASAISPRQVLITRKEDLDELGIDCGALMENIIVSGLAVGSFQPGALLKIGPHLQIRLTFHCEPCKKIAAAVPSLEAVRGRRGILGVVLEDGNATIGDSVVCVPGRFDPLSDIPFERFLDLIRQVPPGQVVTFKMVTQGMGVAEGYLRAIPRYMEKAVLANIPVPVHRIVDEAGNTLYKHLPRQAEMLQQEGVELEKREDLFATPGLFSVSLSRYRWPGASLYMG